MNVVIDARGAISVNGAPVKDDAALLAAGSGAVAVNSDLRAVIQADGGVTHRTMMRVLDLLRRSGIDRITFAAVPSDEASSRR